MNALFRTIGRFRRDQRGNIAVIFAIALLPILSAVGCAIDYSLATRMKAKLQSAADAASVASISQKSLGYLAAAQMTGDGSVAAGVTDPCGPTATVRPPRRPSVRTKSRGTSSSGGAQRQNR